MIKRKRGNGQQKCGFKSLFSIGRKLQKNHRESLYVGWEKEKYTVGGMER